MPLRVLALLALALVAGCSADEVNSPLSFFPGAEKSSWSACDKFGATGDQTQICAAFIIDPNTGKATAYSISYYLPRTLHVRLAAFDTHGALVKVLQDADETATIGPYRTPPIIWDFTNARGERVPRGDYRCYFSAGEGFLSFSDVEVP